MFKIKLLLEFCVPARDQPALFDSFLAFLVPLDNIRHRFQPMFSLKTFTFYFYPRTLTKLSNHS